MFTMGGVGHGVRVLSRMVGVDVFSLSEHECAGLLSASGTSRWDLGGPAKWAFGLACPLRPSGN
jgi:hypothetical protein